MINLIVKKYFILYVFILCSCQKTIIYNYQKLANEAFAYMVENGDSLSVFQEMKAKSDSINGYFIYYYSLEKGSTHRCKTICFFAENSPYRNTHFRTFLKKNYVYVLNGEPDIMGRAHIYGYLDKNYQYPNIGKDIYMISKSKKYTEYIQCIHVKGVGYRFYFENKQDEVLRHFWFPYKNLKDIKKDSLMGVAFTKIDKEFLITPPILFGKNIIKNGYDGCYYDNYD